MSFLEIRSEISTRHASLFLTAMFLWSSQIHAEEILSLGSGDSVTRTMPFSCQPIEVNNDFGSVDIVADSAVPEEAILKLENMDDSTAKIHILKKERLFVKVEYPTHYQNQEDFGHGGNGEYIVNAQVINGANGGDGGSGVAGGKGGKGGAGVELSGGGKIIISGGVITGGRGGNGGAGGGRGGDGGAGIVINNNEKRNDGKAFGQLRGVKLALHIPPSQVCSKTDSVKLSSKTANVKVFKLNSSLTVETYSGDIKVFEHTGNLMTRAATGSLIVKKLAGKLSAKSNTGDIWVVNQNGGAANVQTATGDVHLSQVGDTVINSGTGEVTVENAENVNIKASTSNLKITSSGYVKAETVTGDIITFGNTHNEVKTTSGTISDYDFD